ncbi:MAG: DUF4149 domain-containing protein [Acidobacteria bacterium]|nr:DUF4149 domain-containing protein [Acidobacteriota bacterium]
MTTTLNFLEHLALTFWFGSILFFSFIVAPTLFRTLDPPEAGKAVRAIFPRYYLAGIFCGLALTAVHTARGVLFYWGGMTIPAIFLFVLLTLANLYARQVLTPAINNAREAGPSAKPQFDKLHRRSVLLNAFTLLGGLVYLYWVSVRGF